MQTSHDNSSFLKKKFPIILVCDNITKAPNIGSLFRVADAFGVEKLIFCGKDIPLGRRMTKTSRATEKVVTYELKENIISFITDMKDKGYLIVSLEITTDSKPLNSYQFFDRPMILVIGDENHGISNAILKLSDVVLHIKMYGQNSSMNVVQAASIALYQITSLIDPNQEF